MYLGTIEEAADQLEAAGYYKDFIREELQEHDQRQPHLFYIEESHPYGEEKLVFAFHFSTGGNRVSLESLTASLLTVPVDHAIINDVDTAELEERMKKIDWRVDYAAASHKRHQEVNANIAGIKKDLARLGEGPEPGGQVLAERLAVKYWSWTPINDYDTYWDKARQPYVTEKIYNTLPTVTQAHQELQDLIKKTLLDKPINNKAMNEENLNYLKDNLKYLGFEDKLNGPLSENMTRQQPEFQLYTQVPHFESQTMDYTLHFKKSESSDRYFFNRYEAKLTGSNADEDKTQTFYINKGRGITAKEAFNLLEGRAVYKTLENKEQQKYNVWMQLDFENKDERSNYKVNTFHDKYNYKLERALDKYNIVELNDPEKKAALMKSMQKGNTQQVTMVVDGKEVKAFIEASPEKRTINVYNEKMKPQEQAVYLKVPVKKNLAQEKAEREAQKQAEGQSQGKKRSRGMHH